MPRYKIAADLKCFDLLLSVVSLHYEVGKEAGELIKILSTNFEVFWMTLWLNKAPIEWGDFSWEKIFRTNEIQRVIYTLDVVDSFVNTDLSGYYQDSEETLLRKSWITRFLALGGFGKLVEIFNVYQHFEPG